MMKITDNSASQAPSYTKPAPAAWRVGDKQSMFLIVVERRPLVRGLLDGWARSLSQGGDVISVDDAEISLAPEILADATAIIIGVTPNSSDDKWLSAQVNWLQAHRPDVALVAVVEPGDLNAVETEIANGLRLRGCILTSSSIELAAAALRLVAAGGTYLPLSGQVNHPLEKPGPSPKPQPPMLDSTVKLTPRERAVLALLNQGTGNKIIAYRLGMSQSTVKAHVHSIISKLNVRNRTEAAVLSCQSNLSQTLSTTGPLSTVKADA